MSVTSDADLVADLDHVLDLADALALPSFEMCTRPSLPGTRETKAPNAAVLTTVPRNRSPILGSCGLAIALIMPIAASAESPSDAPT